MSSSHSNTETAQQRRERLLLAQAERQRIREEEVAKQEAEFAAEMERLEEEAAREEEEKRLAEERRVAEEKRIEEEERVKEEKRVVEEKRAEEKRIAEKKLAEERELAEAMRLEEERIAELKRFEEDIINEEKRVAEEKKQKRIRTAEAKRREEEQLAEAEDAEEQNAALAKLLEENRMEKEKAAEKLAKRRGTTRNTSRPVVSVVIPPRASGSTSKVFKSKSVISDESDDVVMGEREVEVPRSVKRKRPIKMIAKNGNVPDPISDRDAEEDDEDARSPPESRSACTRTQACELCHVQRQRCSWIGDHASRRSRGKRAKLEDDVYRGPAARVTDRKFVTPEIAEQLAVLAGQNLELVGIARRSLEVQEKILSIMERRENREIKMVRGEKEEEEDEDGEGEEDEEEKEKNDEKKRNAIREGKKRAE
ncbi:hypothetical protein F5890DRAFT_1560386 [Lentinula detonsa]|uniref:Uncharacterized protein n=1 Tax=Lentinula detonsa TaxID=2804962 RepID=A0AA38PNC4_9AGAR|nr:hypothetical protein F5890DRAFT_1560386 [Lentinula detonsa]